MVADPRNSYNIAVTISNADEGLKVVCRNLTSGGSQTLALDGNKKAVFDLANNSAGFSVNDVIQVEIHGRESGVVQTTVASGGGGRILSITSSDDSSVSVSL